MMYLVYIIILNFFCFIILVFLAIFNIVKRLNKLNLLSQVNKVDIILNLEFLVIAIYISIYYFHEFYYFINLENIYISNNFDYIINYNIKNYIIYNTINKKLDFLKNSKISKFTKYSFRLIDFLYCKTNISIINIVSKNNSEYSNELSIIKQLEIYKFTRKKIILIRNIFNRS